MYYPDLSSPVSRSTHNSGDDSDSQKFDPEHFRLHQKAQASGSKVLYIGWLEAESSYSQGEASPQFVEALKTLCYNPTHQWLGSHNCEFCGASPIVNGLILGSADIEVHGETAIYIAPALTIHYVTAHHYLPPQEFIDAVLATN